MRILFITAALIVFGCSSSQSKKPQASHKAGEKPLGDDVSDSLSKFGDEVSQLAENDRGSVNDPNDVRGRLIAEEMRLSDHAKLLRKRIAGSSDETKPEKAESPAESKEDAALSPEQRKAKLEKELADTEKELEDVRARRKEEENKAATPD